MEIYSNTWGDESGLFETEFSDDEWFSLSMIVGCYLLDVDLGKNLVVRHWDEEGVFTNVRTGEVLTNQAVTYI